MNIERTESVESPELVKAVSPVFLHQIQPRRSTWGKNNQRATTDLEFARERWTTSIERRNMWEAANRLHKEVKATFPTDVLGKFFLQLKTFNLPKGSRVTDDKVVNRQLGGAEQKAFGGVVTVSGVAQQRLEFWSMVQLSYMGIKPSDVQNTYELENEVAIEMQKSMLLQAEIPAWREEARRLNTPHAFVSHRITAAHRHNKLGSDPTSPMVEVGTGPRLMRAYAQVYLNSGNQPSDMARFRCDEYGNSYLSKPLWIPQSDINPEDRYMPLEWWARYGLSYLSQVKPVKYYPKGVPTIELISKKYAAKSSTRARMVDLGIAGREFVEDLSIALRPGIACLMEMTGTYNYVVTGEDEKADTFDHWENFYFGAVVTYGETRMRYDFWRSAYSSYNSWRDRQRYMPGGFTPYHQPNEVEVKISAWGWLLNGHEPEEICRPLQLGRAGVSKPVSRMTLPANWHDLGYRPLHFWIGNEFIYENAIPEHFKHVF